MTTAMKHLTVTAKGPTARGTFDFTIHANPTEGDHHGERIESWANLPATVPLRYQHVPDAADPGAKIGEADVRFNANGAGQDGRRVPGPAQPARRARDRRRGPARA